MVNIQLTETHQITVGDVLLASLIGLCGPVGILAILFAFAVQRGDQEVLYHR